jgi:peptidoglycan hydrolase CwlO-like protein
MEKLKKIWLWISGGIMAIVGLVFVFSKMFGGSQEKRQFKKDKKKIEDEIEDVKTKTKVVKDKKADTKKKIAKADKKIKETEKGVKDTKGAKETLTDFKKKYKK